MGKPYLVTSYRVYKTEYFNVSKYFGKTFMVNTVDPDQTAPFNQDLWALLGLSGPFTHSVD